MHVFDSGVDYAFVFRYYGDSTYWDTSQNSEIFIAYATIDGKGGSKGHNDFSGERKRTKEKLIDVFEKEFVNILDEEIGSKHKIGTE